MLVSTEEKSAYSSDQVLKMFNPFTGELWLLSAAFLVACAWVLYWVEQFHQPEKDSKKKMAQLSLKHQLRTKAHLETLIVDNFEPTRGMAAIAKFPRYFADMFQVLIQQNYISDMSRVGVVFTMTFCAFSLLWVSFYISELTAQLALETKVLVYQSIDELAAAGGIACVKQGAAYVNWLSSYYPTLNTLGKLTQGEMMTSMSSGECDAILESNIALKAMLNGAVDLNLTAASLWCDPTLKVIQGMLPLKQGTTDMAVGIRDNQNLEEALSYWIVALRTCNEETPSSLCYRGKLNGINFKRLEAFYYERSRCPVAEIQMEKYQLTLTNMALPTIILLATALISFFWFRWRNRATVPLWGRCAKVCSGVDTSSSWSRKVHSGITDIHKMFLMPAW
jgi:hypothetical protein